MGNKKVEILEGLQYKSVDQIITWYKNQLKSEKDYYKDIESDLCDLRSKKILPATCKEDLDVNYQIDIKLIEDEKILREQKEVVEDFEMEIHNNIMKALNEKAELDEVPEKYREKVIAYAWDRGHSSGYSEYYNILCGLITIFEEEV